MIVRQARSAQRERNTGAHHAPPLEIHHPAWAVLLYPTALGAATARTSEGDRMNDLPRVSFAHIGGSGTWGFPYPDGSLDGHPYLSVAVVDPDIQVETPYGPSPSFRRCRITDRRAGTERDYL